jgi:hypothetical protein
MENRSQALLTALLVLALALSGCGVDERSAQPAEVRLYVTSWTELDGRPGAGFYLQVRSIEIDRRRWTVRARFRNETGLSWRIGRPHFPGANKIGLVVSVGDYDPLANARRAGGLTPQLLADSFSPPFPEHLPPGAVWSGSFSGSGRPIAGARVRVAIGRLTTHENPPPRLPSRLIVVSSHVLVLR